MGLVAFLGGMYLYIAAVVFIFLTYTLVVAKFQHDETAEWGFLIAFVWYALWWPYYTYKIRKEWHS